MNKSKKVFWVGFVIGVVYFLVTYIFEVLTTGCPWNLTKDMCGLITNMASLPSVVLVNAVAKLFMSPNFSFSFPFLALALVAVIDGFIFGFVFVGIHKIFNKLFKK